MTPSIKAILARFQGNKKKAIEYCAEVAKQYPHLDVEYRTHLDTLRGGHNGESTAMAK